MQRSASPEYEPLGGLDNTTPIDKLRLNIAVGGAEITLQGQKSCQDAVYQALISNGKDYICRLEEAARFEKLLIPAVCSGDSGNLDIALRLEPHSSSDWTSAGAGRSVFRKGIVNQQCRRRGIFLLHYAVLARKEECVRVLLQNGACVDAESQRARRFSYWITKDPIGRIAARVTPLWLAIALKEYDIARLLLQFDAQVVPAFVTMPVQVLVCAWELAFDDSAALEVIHFSGRHYVPFLLVARVLKGAQDISNGSLMRLLEVGGGPSWSDFEVQSSIMTLSVPVQVAGSDTAAKRVLELMPCRTFEDIACKSMAVRCLLLMFLDQVRHTRWQTFDLDLLTVLIREGACLTGYAGKAQEIAISAAAKAVHFDSYHKHASTTPDINRRKLPSTFSTLAPRNGHPSCEVCRMYLCPICVSHLQNPGKLYTLPRLLPVVDCYCGVGGDADDESFLALLALTDVPWLTSAADIPYYGRVLHDGPTCFHAPLTDAQRRVTLRMCTLGSAAAPTLKSLCRQSLVQLRPCRNGLVQFVSVLPVSDLLKAYLLSLKN